LIQFQVPTKNILLECGQIFFNHFIQIHYTPNTVNFLQLMYQGLAAQCKSGKCGLDNLFTIYLTWKSDKLNVNKITFYGIQTKWVWMVIIVWGGISGKESSS
jgi:hypothetical protein